MTYEANIKEFMDKKKKKKKKKIILFTLNDFFISYITTLYGKLRYYTGEPAIKRRSCSSSIIRNINFAI